MAKIKAKSQKRDSHFSRAKEKVADSNSELVKFSFKYFVDNHPKFIIRDHESAYFLRLLDRLRDVSKMTINEFRQNKSNALRAHSIDWNTTSESCFGIPGEDQICEEPYQFSLSANEYGRIHGFLIQNRFYVVWFDKEHLLYK